MNINSWQQNISQDLNNSHQQSSHQTWRTSVETQETNLKSKKKCKAIEFSVTKILEEDGDMEEKKNQEWEKKSAEILSHILF